MRIGVARASIRQACICICWQHICMLLHFNIQLANTQPFPHTGVCLSSRLRTSNSRLPASHYSCLPDSSLDLRVLHANIGVVEHIQNAQINGKMRGSLGIGIVSDMLCFIQLDLTVFNLIYAPSSSFFLSLPLVDKIVVGYSTCVLVTSPRYCPSEAALTQKPCCRAQEASWSKTKTSCRKDESNEPASGEAKKGGLKTSSVSRQFSRLSRIDGAHRIPKLSSEGLFHSQAG